MLASGYTNMQSIFSNMIEKIISCIDVPSYKLHERAEYPLKYHYLISEIFDTIDGWLDRFNEDDNYQVNNSLLSYFPTCMRLCIKEVIKGYEQGVISEDFVLRMIHYHLMMIYYKHDLKAELMDEIEQKCILELPPNLIESILTYSLDESFALAMWQFKKGEFHHSGSDAHEMIIIERLYNLLKGHNLLWSAISKKQGHSGL